MYLKGDNYLQYIFLQVLLKTRFASTKICNLYEEMVQGRHNM